MPSLYGFLYPTRARGITVNPTVNPILPGLFLSFWAWERVNSLTDWAFDVSIMACCNVTTTSQTSQMIFRLPSWIPSLQSNSWQWRQKIYIYEFVLRIKQAQELKYYLLLASEGQKKNEKQTQKRQKKTENSQNTLLNGNVNHHRHIIDTGKFSLINVRKSHETCWLFV